MPLLKISSSKILESKKEVLVDLLWKDFESILHIPSFEVCFYEPISLFVNGIKADHKLIILEMEGPDLNSSAIEMLDVTFYRRCQQVCEDVQLEITFIYHANDSDHVGGPYGLLSNLLNTKTSSN